MPRFVCAERGEAPASPTFLGSSSEQRCAERSASLGQLGSRRAATPFGKWRMSDRSGQMLWAGGRGGCREGKMQKRPCLGLVGQKARPVGSRFRERERTCNFGFVRLLACTSAKRCAYWCAVEKEKDGRGARLRITVAFVLSKRRDGGTPAAEPYGS